MIRKSGILVESNDRDNIPSNQYLENICSIVGGPIAWCEFCDRHLILIHCLKVKKHLIFFCNIPCYQNWVNCGGSIPKKNEELE
jgi:hypothetical protein